MQSEILPTFPRCHQSHRVTANSFLDMMADPTLHTSNMQPLCMHTFYEMRENTRRSSEPEVSTALRHLAIQVCSPVWSHKHKLSSLPFRNTKAWAIRFQSFDVWLRRTPHVSSDSSNRVVSKYVLAFVKDNILSCITRLTLNLWYGRFDFFFFFFPFDVHESITITLLTVSCQKLLEYRLLTYCSRESGYSLDRDGFPGLQAQSLASVKSLVFTILPIDLQLSLFLWLCERTTKWQSRKTETDGGDEWST